MATLIVSDWDRVKGDVYCYGAQGGRSTHWALLGALGKKYTELKQYDDAEQSLKQLMWSCPVTNGLTRNWQLATKPKAIHNPCPRPRSMAAPDQDRVRRTGACPGFGVQIANKLMKEGRWEEAKPYAESAAATGSALGMECASTLRPRDSSNGTKPNSG